MKKHYDESLGEVFNSNNNAPPIILNQRFNSWKNNIEEAIKTRSGGYGSDENTKLFMEVREHVDKFSKEIKNDKIIGLTHPFYLSLTHMHCLTKNNEKDAQKYLQNLTSTLKNKEDREIVIFETLHHYAAITSLLLEQGLIDKAIITGFDRGDIHEKSDLDSLKNKTFYMGGGYNGRCLNNTLSDLTDTTPIEKIFAIRDLVLNSPQDNKDTLFGKNIGYLDDCQIVSLEDALKATISRSH